MERYASLMLAGVFGIVAGGSTLSYYTPEAAIWSFAAAVVVFGLGSLVAGALQGLGVY